MKRYGNPSLCNEMYNFIIESANSINVDDIIITSVKPSIEIINLKCNNFNLKMLDDTYDQITLKNGKYTITFNDWIISFRNTKEMYSIPSPGNDDDYPDCDLYFTEIMSEDIFFQESLLFDFGPVTFELINAMNKILNTTRDFISNDIDYITKRMKRRKSKNIVGR